jgi:hypothetical protein
MQAGDPNTQDSLWYVVHTLTFLARVLPTSRKNSLLVQLFFHRNKSEGAPGFTISKPDQKPVLTSFDENRENRKNRLVFGTKFKIQILVRKPKT